MTNYTFDEFDNYRKEQKAEMTLEEKLKKALIKLMFDYYEHGANTHTIIPDSDAKTIIEICQQEIDEACKKQREIINDNIGSWKEGISFAIQHAIEQQEQEYKEEYFLGREEAFKYAVRMHDEHFNAPSPKESNK